MPMLPEFIITHDGIKMSYCSYGEGKPIIFLHGWGMEASIFNYQISYFSKDYKVIAPDLRGHGRSDPGEIGISFSIMADDIIYLLDSINESVCMIAWSMASFIAFNIIAGVVSKKRELLKSLIIVGGTAKFINSMDYTGGQSLTKIKWLKKKIVRDYPNGILEFQKGMFCSAEYKNAREFNEIIALLSSLKLPSTPVAVRTLDLLIESDYRRYLSHIDIPVMIIHGREDMVCPLDSAYYLKGHIKGARLKVIADTGHAPFLTKPEEFNKKIEIFLESIGYN